MAKYVVYEIWTKSRIVEADSETHAYDVGEPEPVSGMSLSNWHLHPVDEKPFVLPTSGGLNNNNQKAS